MRMRTFVYEIILLDIAGLLQKPHTVCPYMCMPAVVVLSAFRFVDAVIIALYSRCIFFYSLFCYCLCFFVFCFRLQTPKQNFHEWINIWTKERSKWVSQQAYEQTNAWTKRMIECAWMNEWNESAWIHVIYEQFTTITLRFQFFFYNSFPSYDYVYVYMYILVFPVYPNNIVISTALRGFQKEKPTKKKQKKWK